MKSIFIFLAAAVFIASTLNFIDLRICIADAGKCERECAK